MALQHTLCVSTTQPEKCGLFTSVQLRSKNTNKKSCYPKSILSSPKQLPFTQLQSPGHDLPDSDSIFTMCPQQHPAPLPLHIHAQDHFPFILVIPSPSLSPPFHSGFRTATNTFPLSLLAPPPAYIPTPDVAFGTLQIADCMAE